MSSSVLTHSGVSLGRPELDEVFVGRKLPAGAHHCVGARVEDGSAAMILAVATVLALPTGVGRPKLLLIQETDARREHGDLHGPGLEALGLPPADIAFVRAKDGADAMLVADEAVRGRAAPVVLLELRRGDRQVDLSISRRFNLAARRAGLFFFLITPDLEATSAAMTRWIVTGSTSKGRKRRLGPPTFQVELVRNRAGSTGSWIVEWSADKRRFGSARQLDSRSARGALALQLTG